MNDIRRAVTQDASRIAEILIFTKRMNYRNIFRDDEFVKGMLYIEGKEVIEWNDSFRDGRTECSD